jgi:hypothetical protein
MRAQGLPLAPCTIAAGMAFKLLELAVASGLSPDAGRAIPLPPRTVNSLETRIPFETQLALWETAMRALGDPGSPSASRRAFARATTASSASRA